MVKETIKSEYVASYAGFTSIYNPIDNDEPLMRNIGESGDIMIYAEDDEEAMTQALTAVEKKNYSEVDNVTKDLKLIKLLKRITIEREIPLKLETAVEEKLWS